MLKFFIKFKMTMHKVWVIFVFAVIRTEIKRYIYVFRGSIRFKQTAMTMESGFY